MIGNHNDRNLTLYKIYVQILAMLFTYILQRNRQKCLCILKSLYSTKNDLKKSPSYIRNIGILAHIDAGKTTTTERMLFYSGRTHTLGEVHHGNTVTDHMEQERQRGITISSAAVTFQWGDYRINLVDTPGHIDFTMEVEQVLNALDGVVVIMDGSAGVEAQTLTVWSQADRHNLPRVVFVNKMDRVDADFEESCKSLINKLGVIPLRLQLPIVEGSKLVGISDVITLEKIVWDNNSCGRQYQRTELSGSLLEEAKKARMQLVDQLTEFDDELADQVIASGTLDNVDKISVYKSVRNVTNKRLAVPMLCGSAYKNMGIQPLLDAVVMFLPRPDERNHLYDCFGEDFCGRVFKVIHDKQRGGPLCFVRVLRGILKKGAKIHEANGRSGEVLGRLYEPLADDLVEVSQVYAGNIAVVAGLKVSRTGDLLTTNTASLNSAKKKLSQLLQKQAKGTSDETKESVLEKGEFLFEVPIPDPVFFCSIELPSLSKASQLDTALMELQREDPSLHVKVDEETAQTVLGGMGELHLEVIAERIRSEYKIDVELGQLQIAYHEKPGIRQRYMHETSKVIGSSSQSVKIDMSLGPIDNKKGGFRLDKTPENAELLAAVYQKFKDAAKRGAESALLRGPLLGSQVIDAEIVLHYLEVGRGTAETFVIAAAAQCVQKLLSMCQCKLMEPLMFVEIAVAEEKLPPVMADISSRRATIQNVGQRGQQKLVEAVIPLSELLGYARTLRTLCSGQAAFTMQPHGYSAMTARDEDIAIRKASGLL